MKASRLLLMRDIREQTNANMAENTLNSQPQNFKCPYEGCGRLFRAQFSLNRHMILHTQNKRYKCKFCDRTFSLPQYLREHEYTHTKEMPYECGVNGCKLRFRQAGKLSLHRRTHPEYIPKKYDYSLNSEKRTKTKAKQNQVALPKSEEDKGAEQINLIKTTESHCDCCCSRTHEDTKFLASHTIPAEECFNLGFKTIPPLRLPLPHDYTHEHSPVATHINLPLEIPGSTFKLNGATMGNNGDEIKEYLETLNKSLFMMGTKVGTPASVNSKHNYGFCTLDLFTLAKDPNM